MQSFIADRWRRWVIALLVIGLVACQPSEEEQARMAEQQRLLCLDKKCPGDAIPIYDHRKRELLKIGGRWYTGPKEYYSVGIQGASFYWWEHQSYSSEMQLPDGLARALRSGESGNYRVYISMISRVSSTEPTGYRLIQMAAERGWIAKRSAPRPGLEKVWMTAEAESPAGWRLDQYTYYIATDQIGPDGLPPVAKCNHSDHRNSGSTGFILPDGFRFGAKWNERHCLDFPEIYKEVVRVYSLLEKAEP